MTLRLVLVGMVAALGVSIPSQPSPEHWFESAEAWATSLLAEWDTWEPTDEDETASAAKRDHLDCEECRLARLRLASSATRAAAGDPPAPKPEVSPSTAPTAVLFEAIRVSLPFEWGIAYELNRLSEELGTLAATAPETVATITEAEPPLPADAFEIAEWDELSAVETAICRGRNSFKK